MFCATVDGSGKTDVKKKGSISKTMTMNRGSEDKKFPIHQVIDYFVMVDYSIYSGCADNNCQHSGETIWGSQREQLSLGH